MCMSNAASKSLVFLSTFVLYELLLKILSHEIAVICQEVVKNLTRQKLDPKFQANLLTFNLQVRLINRLF